MRLLNFVCSTELCLLFCVGSHHDTKTSLYNAIQLSKTTNRSLLNDRKVESVLL